MYYVDSGPHSPTFVLHRFPRCGKSDLAGAAMVKVIEARMAESSRIHLRCMVNLHLHVREADLERNWDITSMRVATK